MFNLIVNNKYITTDLPSGSVVLDLLRNELRLTGTKDGCREGECGACMVLVGEHTGGDISYKSVNSCLLPLGETECKHIVTVEGLNLDALSPIQTAILENGATQCGFCTPGIVVSLTAFLLGADEISEETAVNFVAGNICRCTGYISIRRAVKTLCKSIDTAKLTKAKTDERIKLLVKWKFLPEYFLEMNKRLSAISVKDKEPREEKTIIVGGGTDLFVQKPDFLRNEHLTFLSEKKELKGISIKEDYLTIGAATTIEELKDSAVIQKYFSKEIFELIASISIRNRATIAGNIVNASPIGDISIFLLALDTKATLVNKQKYRTIPLKNLFRSYKKLDMSTGETIESFGFPIPGEKTFFNFEKVSRRMYQDIATVNSAIQLLIENNLVKFVNISAGGVAPIPLYLSKACEYLIGKKINSTTIKETLLIAQDEISPIDDVRGSEKYKRLLLQQLFKAHFHKLKGLSTDDRRPTTD